MKTKFIGYLFIFCLFAAVGCSSDGPPCGDTVCSAGEVCESGDCVLALVIEGDEDPEGCLGDEDCPSHKICTEPDSEPGATCIPRLSCQRDHDCQTGLQCDEDGLCR
ncbi:MAG: hypothetical protein R3257_02955 [bacterium]|nr:hypothetical protein [bacterium]